MFPKSWAPAPVGDLILVGPEGDGGYIVVERSLTPVSLLISMGLNDDWRFEEDFHRRTGARVVCFDGTVNRRFWLRHFAESIVRLNVPRALTYWRYRRFFSSPNIRHECRMIGYDVEGSTSLRSIMSGVSDAHIFLKVDIEGSEYRILDDIVRYARRFTGVVIEFHDVDLHRDRIDRFIDAMPDFVVTAVHPNNWAGADPHGDPVVLELSLTARRYVRPPVAGEETPTLPPSNPAVPDVVAQYS